MSEIGDFLSASAEAAYAAFQSRLLPGVSNIVGVRMPLIRRYVKQALKDGRWRDWPEMDAGAPYEEIMIRGLVLAQADLPFDEHTRVMEAFLQRIDNWGVCDSVCASCRFLRGDRVRGYRWLARLLESDEEFTVRFALVCLCDHFARERGWTQRVLEAARAANCGEYNYARMALAWLLAETASTDAGAVMTFLRGDVDPFVRARAVRKIKESCKISASDKSAFDDVLRDMSDKGEDTH